MGLNATADLASIENSAIKQESNMSHAGPEVYALAGTQIKEWRQYGPHPWECIPVLTTEQTYEDKDLKPRGKLIAVQSNETHGGQKDVAINSWYGGENYAAIFSVSTHALLVPTLDAFSDLWVRVERIKGYMDILSIVHGDGFPNCEAFIKDPAGNKLFLGTHVRIGYPLSMLPGTNHRLMWANTIRVQIDEQGNFGENLWIFANVLGGPPDYREEYPTKAELEVIKKLPEPKIIYMPSKGTVFMWDCGDINDVIKQVGTMSKPLRLSAYTPIDELRAKMQKTWEIGPVDKITRTQWNDHHLHRDPNEGRSKDDYDLLERQWKK